MAETHRCSSVCPEVTEQPRQRVGTWLEEQDVTSGEAAHAAYGRLVGGLLAQAGQLAGRSGSAIAAGLGSMKVAEEVDALTAMGLDPVEFLALPRVLAMMIMLPCLTVLADVVGMAGGVAVAWVSLGIPAANYIQQTLNALMVRDLVSGLIKSWVFAGIIAGVGCYEGFRVEGGAEGVGRRTTASVVVSIFLIIAADLLFTLIFYALE